MEIPVTEIVTNALRLCGQMGWPGRAYSVDQGVEVLGRLNRMLDSWNAIRPNIYQIAIERFTLVADQVTYTIGDGGDFDTDRPDQILRANIILTSSTPEVRTPLYLMNYDEWASQPVPELAVSLPIKLYVDNDYPLRKAYFWGYSNAANDVEFFWTKQLPAALLISDDVLLPDGYIEAIEYSLAERIAPLYWAKTNALLSEVKDIARKARAAIQTANSRPLALANDATGPTRSGRTTPYFNYLTGDLR